MSVIRELLNEGINPFTAMSLHEGDILWIKPALSPVKVKFIEFIQGQGSRKDCVKVEYFDDYENKPPRGWDIFNLSSVFLEEPDKANRSKKAFLNKGVHGTRKWK